MQAEKALVLSDTRGDEPVQVVREIAGVVTLHGSTYRPLSHYYASKPLWTPRTA